MVLLWETICLKIPSYSARPVGHVAYDLVIHLTIKDCVLESDAVVSSRWLMKQFSLFLHLALMETAERFENFLHMTLIAVEEGNMALQLQGGGPFCQLVNCSLHGLEASNYMNHKHITNHGESPGGFAHSRLGTEPN